MLYSSPDLFTTILPIRDGVAVAVKLKKSNLAMLKLLCTTAHPDDEAWAFGGTLLKYRELGVETHVICLTRGMAATNRGAAEVRRATRPDSHSRVLSSLQIVESQLCHHPQLPRWRLTQSNFLKVAADLTRRIREIKPQIVLTLGLEGTVTAHLDHAAVGIFTTAAYHWAGRTDRFPEQLADGLLTAPGPKALLRDRFADMARAPASIIVARNHTHRRGAICWGQDRSLPRLTPASCHSWKPTATAL